MNGKNKPLIGIITLLIISNLTGCGIAIETSRIDSGDHESNLIDLRLERIEQYSKGIDLLYFFIPVGFYSDSDISNKIYPYNINMQLLSKDNYTIIDIAESILYVNKKPYDLIGAEIISSEYQSGNYNGLWIRDCEYIQDNYPRIKKYEKYSYSKEHVNFTRNYYDSENIIDICRNKRNIKSLGARPVVQLKKDIPLNIKLLYDYKGKSNLDENDISLSLDAAISTIDIVIESSSKTYTKTYGTQGYNIP